MPRVPARRGYHELCPTSRLPNLSTGANLRAGVGRGRRAAVPSPVHHVLARAVGVDADVLARPRPFRRADALSRANGTPRDSRRDPVVYRLGYATARAEAALDLELGRACAPADLPSSRAVRDGPAQRVRQLSVIFRVVHLDAGLAVDAVAGTLCNHLMRADRAHSTGGDLGRQARAVEADRKASLETTRDVTGREQLGDAPRRQEWEGGCPPSESSVARDEVEEASVAFAMAADRGDEVELDALGRQLAQSCEQVERAFRHIDLPVHA